MSSEAALSAVQALFRIEKPLLTRLELFIEESEYHLDHFAGDLGDMLLELSKHAGQLREFFLFSAPQDEGAFEVFARYAAMLETLHIEYNEVCPFAELVEDIVASFVVVCPRLRHLELRELDAAEKISKRSRICVAACVSKERKKCM